MGDLRLRGQEQLLYPGSRDTPRVPIRVFRTLWWTRCADTDGVVLVY